MFYITTTPMEAKNAVDGTIVLLDHLLSLMEYNKETELVVLKLKGNK